MHIYKHPHIRTQLNHTYVWRCVIPSVFISFYLRLSHVRKRDKREADVWWHPTTSRHSKRKNARSVVMTHLFIVSSKWTNSSPLSLSLCLTHCPLLRLVFRLLDDISKSSWASFVRAAHNKRATLPSLGAIMVPLFWLLLLAKLPKLALFSGSDRCVIQEINNSQNGKYMPGVILQTTTFLIVFNFYCTFILKYSDFCIFSL